MTESPLFSPEHSIANAAGKPLNPTIPGKTRREGKFQNEDSFTVKPFHLIVRNKQVCLPARPPFEQMRFGAADGPALP